MTFKGACSAACFGGESAGVEFKNSHLLKALSLSPPVSFIPEFKGIVIEDWKREINALRSKRKEKEEVSFVDPAVRMRDLLRKRVLSHVRIIRVRIINPNLSI